MAHLLLDTPEERINPITRAVRRLKLPGRIGLSFYFGTRELFIGIQITPVEVQVRKIRTSPAKSFFAPIDN